MTKPYLPEYSGIEIGELGLKDQTESELFGNLLAAGENWSPEEVQMVANSLELAKDIHQGDTHRGLPYTYHLLRNANRVSGYLHLPDPELISATLLHDGPEDHPDKIIAFGNLTLDSSEQVNYYLLDPIQRQLASFDVIERTTTRRVRNGVSAVTNAPTEIQLSEAQFLAVYKHKVEIAVVGPDGFIIKIVDWIDNGIGIIHSDSDDTSQDKHDYFSAKYGMVQPIFEARFRQPDIQAMLDPQAKAYLEYAFKLGRSRLIVPEGNQ